MSRNVQKKHPTTPVKVSKRRDSDVSSSLDLSDEGGYSAVEDITDSDEDEEDVDAVEEEHILTNALQKVAPSSPRPVQDQEEGDDEHEDDGGDADADDDDDGDDDDDADSSPSWDGIPSDTDAAHPTEQIIEDPFISGPEDSGAPRRVRFNVPESSSGESTETDDDIDHGFFPDIFVDQSSLDPSFRREIENDPDDDNSSNSGFWDFRETGDGGVADAELDAFIMKVLENDDSTHTHTPTTPTASTSYDLFSPAEPTPMPSPDRNDDDESLDGYQSDGDTTDEEDPPEKPPRRKARKEKADDLFDTESITIIKSERGQPRIGRFNLDGSSKKPVAIVNPHTGKMMIFTPERSSNRGLDLSPEQFDLQWFQPIPEASPMVNSGNMMMSAMVSSNTFGDFMNTQAVGPAEAFFSFSADTNFFEGSSDADLDVADEGEKDLHLDDFLTFDHDFAPSSDDEQGDDNTATEDPIFRTPARPGTSSSDVTSLLDHFGNNADIVGAFRRDQANHQLISRSKATRESLAFSGPYYEGTLRGIKDGRIATTNVPISPRRKQRKVPDMASSPLAGVSQKRKVSSEHQWAHKRQRSIPDIDLLGV